MALPTSPAPLESESVDTASAAKELGRGAGLGPARTQEGDGCPNLQRLGHPFKRRRGEPARQG